MARRSNSSDSDSSLLENGDRLSQTTRKKRTAKRKAANKSAAANKKATNKKAANKKAAKTKTANKKAANKKATNKPAANKKAAKTKTANKKAANKSAAGGGRADERIAELEAELSAARATIGALLDNLESRLDVEDEAEAQHSTRLCARPDAPGGAGDRAGPDPAADAQNEQALEQLLRQRTRALVEAETQLQHKTTELERLSEMKVEFISIATHELRTPLTSIVGYLDLLEEGRFGEVPDSMERPMASLRRNAHRLKRLVDEMLDVSRIDSGRVTLLRTRCNLASIIPDVVADLQSQAESKRQELRLVIDDPPDIYADLDKARQVAHKMIANTIRHTPEAGVITVTVDTAPPERFAGIWARLRVRGTGITIPPDMHSRIFEPFAAIHKARHHTSAGPDAAGLGLYIARGLVDLHGGLISIDSVEGEYAEFIVLLPESEPTDNDSYR
jgi:signal transduction histidine kinase